MGTHTYIPTCTVSGTFVLLLLLIQASLVTLGEEGYMKHVADILESVRIISEGVRLVK